MPTLGLSETTEETPDKSVPLGLSGSITLGTSAVSIRSAKSQNLTLESIAGILPQTSKNKVAVIPVDAPDEYIAFDYGTNGAGIKQALYHMYSQFDGPEENAPSYVLYLGNNGIVISAAGFTSVFSDTAPENPTASNITLKNLKHKVNTLTITGSITDPVDSGTLLPKDATSFGGLSEFAVDTNIILRNIQLSNIEIRAYMNAHTALLDHGFSLTNAGVNYIYGGGKSANLTGNVDLTINSSHTGGTLYVYGGSVNGTISGNINLVINALSNRPIGGIWGGNSGAGSIEGNISTIINSLPEQTIHAFGGGGVANNVSGSVFNRITNMEALITNYYGGTSSETADTNVLGGITNIIKPENKATARLAGISNFYAGSNRGVVGQEGQTSQAITTEFDSRNFGIGRYIAEFAGANRRIGTIYGDISTTVHAGDYNTGGRIHQFHGGASTYAEIIYLSTAIDGLSPQAVAEQYKAKTNYKIFGNITNIIEGGCFGNGANVYNTGAGRTGYIEGDIYTELGTKTKVYGGNYSTVSIEEVAGTRAQNIRGSNTQMDWTGSGGYPAAPDTKDLFIKGTTKLVHRQTLARWTYGAGYSGLIWGDTSIELYGGVVDTLEGGGYMDCAIWGNTTATVYGGQVDWFLAGGGWLGKYIKGDAEVSIHGGTINAHIGGAYSTSKIDGNTTVNIYAGDFSGSPRAGDIIKKMASGPSQAGTITGNAKFNLDLTNCPEDKFIGPPSGTFISGGRPYGALAGTVLGTDADNTVELNIKTRAGSNLLNKVILYIDGGINGVTHSGNLTANIDAPDSNIGGLFASQASILGTTPGRILKNVDINVFNANEIGELAGSNPSDNFEDSNASDPNGKQVRINFLGRNENETPLTNVGSAGIYNFTHMSIENYKVKVENGSIRNSKKATGAARGSAYKFGEIALNENGSFGVEGTNVFITAGDLYVTGNPTISSPSGNRIINLSSVTMAQGATLNWVRNGGTTIASTGTWFGATPAAYRVITFSPSVCRENAKVLRPDNFFGSNETGSGYYLGDNDMVSNSADSYGIVVEGMRIDFAVESGRGTIAHNTDALTSTTQPGEVTALSNVGKGVETRKGWLIVPTVTRPFPALRFTPDKSTYHSIEQISIKDGDGNEVIIPQQGNSNPYEYSFDKAGHYTVGVRYETILELTAKNAVITESEALAINSENEVLQLVGAKGQPQFTHNIDSSMLSAITSHLGADSYRVHNLTFKADNNITSKSMEVKLFVVPDDATIDTGRNYALWAKDVTISLLQAGNIADSQALNAYTQAFAIDVTGGSVAVPEIGNPQVVEEIKNATVPTVKTVNYSYHSLTRDSIVTITANAPEVISVPHLTFGKHVNNGIPHNIPLESSATIQIKDERPEGSPWNLSVVASEFVSNDGLYNIPPVQLVYVDTAGVFHPLDTPYTVWSGASRSDEAIQSKQWGQGGLTDTVMFKATGIERPSDYKANIIWSISYTP